MPSFDWAAIVGTPAAKRLPIVRLRKGRDRVLVEAQDLGYAVQVWTVRVVGRDRQTIALSRFHDPDELARDVEATKAAYLKMGWNEE